MYLFLAFPKFINCPMLDTLRDPKVYIKKNILPLMNFNLVNAYNSIEWANNIYVMHILYLGGQLKTHQSLMLKDRQVHTRIHMHTQN